MNNELQLLREFRADLPAPTEETRVRIYDYATRGTRLRGLRRRAQQPRVRVAAVLTVVAIAASLSAVFVLNQSRAPSTTVGLGPNATIGSPTLAHPLNDGQQTTLAAASAAWGTPLVLPSTALVQPSDAGSVWATTTGSKEAAVAVTFPSQGLIVQYLQPAPFSDPQTGFQQMAQGIAGAEEIDLNGTPALAIPQNSDNTGQNFGVVAFQADGGEVAVMGHKDSATLERVAQSILDRSGS